MSKCLDCQGGHQNHMIEITWKFPVRVKVCVCANRWSVGGGKTVAQRRHGNRRMGQEDPRAKRRGAGQEVWSMLIFYQENGYGLWLWMFRGFVLTDHGNYGKIDAPCKKKVRLHAVMRCRLSNSQFHRFIDYGRKTRYQNRLCGVDLHYSLIPRIFVSIGTLACPPYDYSSVKLEKSSNATCSKAHN